jgi:hypothetical protein
MYLSYFSQLYAPYVEPHDDHHGEGLLSLRSSNQDSQRLWLLSSLYNDVDATCGLDVTPPKLASPNLVESLAIHPVELTCDQVGNRPYKKCQSKCKGR